MDNSRKKHKEKSSCCEAGRGASERGGRLEAFWGAGWSGNDSGEPGSCALCRGTVTVSPLLALLWRVWEKQRLDLI